MADETTPVPQPSEGALDTYEICMAIASELVPGWSLVKATSDVLIRRRMQHGQRILIEEISRSGRDALTDERFNYYVPAAYRFFEQVRLGEYEHNLKILAKIISRDLEPDVLAPDVGRVARAASKLEMLPEAHLVALAYCERAFEIYRASDQYDGYWLCIDSHNLKASFAEAQIDVEPINCQEWLHELSSRGLLTLGAHPGAVGGFFYYRNDIFDEIINAAKATIDEGKTCL